MQKIIPLLVFISFVAAGYSQNLVPNGDFEEYTTLPSGPGEWFKCKNWSSVNDYPEFKYPYGSPDYLHTAGSGDARLPACVFGNVQPYSGNACMGFVLWHGGTGNFREYLSVKLTTPMITGVSYHVSFWISNGAANWNSNSSSTHFGVRFSDSTLVQKEHESIGCQPSFEIPEQIWNTSWEKVSFVFVADADYDFVTFGNFFEDTETDHKVRVHEGDDSAYYFIDNVEIWPVSIGSVPSLKTESRLHK